MTDGADIKVLEASGGFTLRTLITLLVIGIVAFGGFLALIGFSDTLQNTNDSRPHGGSKSPNGFNAFAQMLEKSGRDVRMLREDDIYRGDALTIYTLVNPLRMEDLDELNIDGATIFVLPKHSVGVFQRLSPPYVKLGRYDVDSIEDLLEPIAGKTQIRRNADKAVFFNVYPSDKSLTKEYLPSVRDSYRIEGWENVQTISGTELITLLSADGSGVFVKVKDKPIYILSDPDLLENSAVKKLETAILARDMILMASYPEDTIYFDLILHGLKIGNNPIKTALRPPLLSATLCLLALGILLAWKAFMRFGAPARQGRAFALGKQALTENTADLIRLTGRQSKMATPYLKLIRKQAREAAQIPASIPDSQLSKVLEDLSRRRNLSVTYSQLEQQSQQVSNVESLLTFSRTAHKWLEELAYEHR